MSLSRCKEGTVKIYFCLFYFFRKQLTADSPDLDAPAVWELDGPTITGPMMSNRFISYLRFSHKYLLMFSIILSYLKLYQIHDTF